ncbi:unnamed protein product [Rotaria sp. Silwood2]|nr:unnamed protein product [Rotaria sp. Silwood2]CAF3343454.1 unnamed protein product [Rotaria sp. Silwood2]CAF4198837.1 unnamed protein product [Rotaria sp. Silwood2]CAF4278915.1 unnamed protein product [Rotaria sp. Silwood2]
MNVVSSSWSNLWFGRLSSVTFAFNDKSIPQSQRVYIIDQILGVSPRLTYLTVEWNYLRYCLHPNKNVKKLELILNVHYIDPNPDIHVNHLFQLLPGICCFVTSGGNLEGYCSIKPEIQLELEQAIITSGNKRLLDSNTYQIIFPKRNKLTIWLS